MERNSYGSSHVYAPFVDRPTASRIWESIVIEQVHEVHFFSFFSELSFPGGKDCVFMVQVLCVCFADINGQAIHASMGLPPALSVTPLLKLENWKSCNLEDSAHLSAKKIFAGARLHIENLSCAESPTLKVRLLNLEEKDPVCFTLWLGQPIDASQKKWILPNRRGTVCVRSMGTLSQMAHLSAKKVFAGARLHIENLSCAESPTLKVRLLNLEEKDPVCFTLWLGQPIDAS
ncbi:hypothetical protein F2Q69_00030922 [Brassica cretica]|uniref:Uncharacterized protein n=1 Tax=Brassica cretica TaxID=69181 RepID=A0A8S9S4I0_BRACR|nr:hypothetical protein F2Q69_00030922 [Brassica cretica]